MYALNLDNEGRILSATFPQYAPADAVIVDALPEGNITDYLYTAGGYVYDPLPEPEKPGPGDTPGTTAEAQLAEMAAAIERGLTT